VTGGRKQDSCGVRVSDGRLPLLVVIGLTAESADSVCYGLNECLNPLIWGYFSNLAIIEQACDGSCADPAEACELVPDAVASQAMTIPHRPSFIVEGASAAPVPPRFLWSSVT
jgi:hypothetical protein